MQSMTSMHVNRSQPMCVKAIKTRRCVVHMVRTGYWMNSCNVAIGLPRYSKTCVRCAYQSALTDTTCLDVCVKSGRAPWSAASTYDKAVIIWLTRQDLSGASFPVARTLPKLELEESDEAGRVFISCMVVTSQRQSSQAVDRFESSNGKAGRRNGGRSKASPTAEF